MLETGTRAAGERPGSPTRGRNLSVGLAMAVVLGLSFPGFRIAVTAVPPYWLSALRVAWALGVLVPIWIVLRPRYSLAPADHVRALVFGTVTLGIPTLLTMIAIVVVPAGQASVLSNTVPLWILVLAAVGVGASRPNRWAAAATVSGFFGVCLMVVPHGVGGPLWANALLLVEAALTGLNAILLQRWFRSVPYLTVLVLGFAWSLALLLVLAVPSGPVPTTLLRPPVFITVALLGLVSTGAIWGLWYLLLERAPATRASLYLYLGPVISIAIAYWFLRETVTAIELAGAALVLGSAFSLEAKDLFAGRSRPSGPTAVE
jgi:drug/metabolite transporter (DMT)-like permease